MHQSDYLGDLAAERARIHDQSAADGAGNSFAEFEPLESAIDHGLDQGSECGSGARHHFDSVVIELNFFETVAEPHNQAAHPAIAYQQVSPRAETERRNSRAVRGALRVHQLGFLLNRYKQIRRPADLK